MTAERIETLCYAVRWRVLLKYLGMLGVVLAALNSVPFARTTGRYLADLFEGRDHMEIIALVKDEARVFSFVAREADEKSIEELDLPRDSRVMFLYRDEKFMLPEPDSRLKRGDEVMIITHSRNIEKLHQRWSG